MKGLLVKDFCILKMQKNVLLVLLAMCVVFTVFLESPTYIVSLMPMYGGIVVLGTLSYDEFDRGYSFLFTLPVSKKGYVKEKYAFGLLLCGGIWILAMLCSLLYVFISGETPLDMSLILSYAAPFVLVLLLLGVALPVQLKCGNEKGRLAVVAVGLGAFLLIAGFGQLIKWLHIDVTAVLEKVSEIGVGTLGVIGLVVLVVFMGISYQVSVHVMEKKEF